MRQPSEDLPAAVDDVPEAGGRRRPSLRPLVDRLAAAVITGPLDRAFDQVFERHLDVRSVDHAEEMLSVIGAREKAQRQRRRLVRAGRVAAARWSCGWSRGAQATSKGGPLLGGRADGRVGRHGDHRRRPHGRDPRSA